MPQTLALVRRGDRPTGVVKRYETFAEMARLLARTDQIRADVEEGKIVLCIDRDDD